MQRLVSFDSETEPKSICRNYLQQEHCCNTMVQLQPNKTITKELPKLSLESENKSLPTALIDAMVRIWQSPFSKCFSTYKIVSPGMLIVNNSHTLLISHNTFQQFISRKVYGSLKQYILAASL